MNLCSSPIFLLSFQDYYLIITFRLHMHSCRTDCLPSSSLSVLWDITTSAYYECAPSSRSFITRIPNCLYLGLPKTNLTEIDS